MQFPMAAIPCAIVYSWYADPWLYSGSGPNAPIYGPAGPELLFLESIIVGSAWGGIAVGVAYLPYLLKRLLTLFRWQP
jgi:hypothetical protein